MSRAGTRLIDAAEVAEMTGFHADTILRWARRGTIPSRKFGRMTRFDRKEIEAWLLKPPRK